MSKDPLLAPPGAIHWWDIGKYGHVAMATENGWAGTVQGNGTQLILTYLG